MMRHKITFKRLAFGCLGLAVLCPLLCIGVILIRHELRWRDDIRAITASGDYELRLRFDDRERTYLLHLPPAYDGQTPLPLVVALHGGAINADIMERVSEISQKSDAEGFIAVYPNGTGRLPDDLLTWNAGNCCAYALDNEVDDVGYIRALLDELEAHLPIDTNRVFVTGISNGGMLTYAVACEMPERITAIAPVAGALNWESCDPSQPVSVVIFHGTADRLVPYEGGTASDRLTNKARIDQSVAYAAEFWAAQNACDTTPQRDEQASVIHEIYTGCNASVEVYTIVDGGHEWFGGSRSEAPLSATDAMWMFFEAVTSTR